MQTMQCMEVWGGNGLVDSGVSMAGLDAWVFSRPYGHSETGGDVHYVSSCATGRITRLLVADVSGHGAEVADIAAGLRRLMRRFINYIDQNAFVREMNGQFSALSQSGRFATALVTTFFAPTNEASVCNAGHPPPLHYSAKKRTWAVLESKQRGAGSAANIPLGIADLGDYEQFGVRLGIGDLVLCYTDSLIESRSADGALLGVNGLLEAARRVEASNPTEFVHALLDAVSKLHEGNLDGDDVTVLLFRPNGMAPCVPIRDRLLAPLRIIRSLARSAVRGGRDGGFPEISIANIGGALFTRLNRRTGLTREP